MTAEHSTDCCLVKGRLHVICRLVEHVWAVQFVESPGVLELKSLASTKVCSEINVKKALIEHGKVVTSVIAYVILWSRILSWVPLELREATLCVESVSARFTKAEIVELLKNNLRSEWQIEKIRPTLGISVDHWVDVFVTHADYSIHLVFECSRAHPSVGLIHICLTVVLWVNGPLSAVRELTVSHIIGESSENAKIKAWTYAAFTAHRNIIVRDTCHVLVDWSSIEFFADELWEFNFTWLWVLEEVVHLVWGNKPKEASNYERNFHLINYLIINYILEPYYIIISI